MDAVGAWANAEDIERLAELELRGLMPQGFAAMALRSSYAYLVRIAALRMTFSVIPYPGPTITIIGSVP